MVPCVCLSWLSALSGMSLAPACRRYRQARLLPRRSSTLRRARARARSVRHSRSASVESSGSLLGWCSRSPESKCAFSPSPEIKGPPRAIARLLSACDTYTISTQISIHLRHTETIDYHADAGSSAADCSTVAPDQLNGRYPSQPARTPSGMFSYLAAGGYITVCLRKFSGAGSQIPHGSRRPTAVTYRAAARRKG